jgi:aryl-alcohol dehydrogenase-like predicted oxidoreductase
MHYKLLGPTGLRVSELCLGAMTFGENWGWGASIEECRKLFNAYLDQGGNFIDTANNYTNGSSETIVGELTKGVRDKVVIATKYTLNTDPEKNINAGGNHRRNMVRAVEQSLQRLKTDYIDLYWVHVWDKVTPIEEIMRGLDDLVSAGKIVYTGFSDAPAWLIAKGNTLAECRGWNKFIALQLEYNLVDHPRSGGAGAWRFSGCHSIALAAISVSPGDTHTRRPQTGSAERQPHLRAI